ncbi:MAG TPA: hypothetical protein VMI35_00340, partial [Puia sp.]|nr:hypothetical protein [Puia sp.]
MAYTGFILSFAWTGLVAWLLIKKYNPQAVLLFTGMLMLLMAELLGYATPPMSESSGSGFIDLFKRIEES